MATDKAASEEERWKPIGLRQVGPGAGLGARQPKAKDGRCGLEYAPNSRREPNAVD